MAYYFSNRSAEALPLLQQAVATNPGDTYFGYALDMAYVYAHDWGRTLARLFYVPPDSPEALVPTSDFLIREKFSAAEFDDKKIASSALSWPERDLAPACVVAVCSPPAVIAPAVALPPTTPMTSHLTAGFEELSLRTVPSGGP